MLLSRHAAAIAIRTQCLPLEISRQRRLWTARPEAWPQSDPARRCKPACLGAAEALVRESTMRYTPCGAKLGEATSTAIISHDGAHIITVVLYHAWSLTCGGSAPNKRSARPEGPSKGRRLNRCAATGQTCRGTAKQTFRKYQPHSQRCALSGIDTLAAPGDGV